MSDTADPTARIEQLRAQMESVDCELVSLIARRCELARALGDAKSAIMLPVADLAREAAVLRRVTGLARATALDEEAVRHIFWCLIDLSRRAQLQDPS
jgi:chorismate mutase